MHQRKSENDAKSDANDDFNDLREPQKISPSHPSHSTGEARSGQIVAYPDVTIQQLPDGRSLVHY